MARGKTSGRTFEDLLNEDLKTRDYKSVYVLEGADTQRIESVVDSIRKGALDAGSAAFNFHLLQADQVGWQGALQQAQSYPMLGSRQLVWLRHIDRIATDKPGETAFLAYLDNPLTSTILVVSAEELDKRRKWVIEARSRGVLVEFARPKGTELLAWARKSATKAKLTLEDDALATLIDLVGGDLKSLTAEIDKLALLAESWGRAPTSEDILKVVMDQLELGAFALSDEVRPGRTAETLVTWRRLRDWGNEAQSLAPLVIAHLRRTAMVGCMLQDGWTPAEIASATRLNSWVLNNKMLPLARGLDGEACGRLLQACLKCERALKRSPVADSLTFERMLVEVTLERAKGVS